MSLTARIAVAPSRRLDQLASVLACGGALVAAVAVASRWPGGPGAIAAGVLVVGVAAIVARGRRDRAAASFTMLVSDRAEVEIVPDPGPVDGDAWRLRDATTVWPGFVVVALRSDAALRTTRIATLLDRELPPVERRALRRFLTWSLRGGAGRAPVADPAGAAR